MPATADYKVVLTKHARRRANARHHLKSAAALRAATAAVAAHVAAHGKPEEAFLAQHDGRDWMVNVKGERTFLVITTYASDDPLNPVVRGYGMRNGKEW